MKTLILKSIQNYTKTILVFSLFLSFMAPFFSCNKSYNKDSVPKMESNIAEIAKVKFKFDGYSQKCSDSIKKIVLLGLQKFSKIYPLLEGELSYSNIKEFYKSNTNEIILLFSFKKDAKKNYAVKGTILDGEFFYDKDLVTSVDIKDDFNGEILVIDNEMFFTIQSINGIYSSKSIGVDNIDNIFKLIKDKEGNHGGDGFCQREEGESFGECYRKEKEEFCTGFFSCLAADTQIPVIILIGLSCKCNATTI